MIFSVFDPYARCYNYYEAPGTSANYGARGTKYRPLKGLGSAVGFEPEALALLLPANARAVGRGEQARGIIATVPSRSLNGLGAEPAAPPSEPSALPPIYPFGQVLAAACVASVVGVFVQKLLNPRRR